MQSNDKVKAMANDLEAVLMKHLGLSERPAIAITYTCEPDFQTAHWFTNVSRQDGMIMMKKTIEAMNTQNN